MQGRAAGRRVRPVAAAGQAGAVNKDGASPVRRRADITLKLERSKPRTVDAQRERGLRRRERNKKGRVPKTRPGVHHREKGCGDGRLACSPASSRGGRRRLRRHRTHVPVEAFRAAFNFFGNSCDPWSPIAPDTRLPERRLRRKQVNRSCSFTVRGGTRACRALRPRRRTARAGKGVSMRSSLIATTGLKLAADPSVRERRRAPPAGAWSAPSPAWRWPAAWSATSPRQPDRRLQPRPARSAISRPSRRPSHDVFAPRYRRPVLNATRARQGRWGRHVFWVLVFGTLLAALGLFARLDLARARPGDHRAHARSEAAARPRPPTRRRRRRRTRRSLRRGATRNEKGAAAGAAPFSLSDVRRVRRPGGWPCAGWKNSAWPIAAFTVSGWKGLVIRKVGSGRSPVSRRSGKAVMKITGTS